MAHFKEHCADCEAALGDPHERVHLWLDELFKKLGSKHRAERHHREGVEEVRRMWGDEAATAAEIHIRKDYYGVDRIPTKAEVLEKWWVYGWM